MTYPMNSDAQQAYNTARQTAKFYSNEYTGTEHLLYGILKTQCVATAIFTANGFSPEKLVSVFVDEKSQVTCEPSDSSRIRENIPFTAYNYAVEIGESQITPDLLMLAILDDRN